MRIAVTLVLDMTDEQVADYVAFAGIPAQPTGHVRAKDVVECVRTEVLSAVRDGEAFGPWYPAGVNTAERRRASVSIKER